MPISGLVVSLTAEGDARRDAIDAIAADQRIEIGESSAHRMALVVETVSKDEDRQVWEWLNDLAGVVLVEVAFVAFDQPSIESPPDAPAPCSTNVMSSSLRGTEPWMPNGENS